MREIIKKIHQVLIFTYIFEGFRRYHVIVGADTAALEFTPRRSSQIVQPVVMGWRPCTECHGVYLYRGIKSSVLKLVTTM